MAHADARGVPMPDSAQWARRSGRNWSLLRPAWKSENIHMHRVFIASGVLALALTAPVGAFAQAAPPPTFNARYPAQPPLPHTPSQPAFPQAPSPPANAH